MLCVKLRYINSFSLDCVVGVCDCMVKLLQLDLTYNNIGPDGALSLAFCLTRNRTLRRLILRHNLIRDAGCEALSHALASSNSSLKELSLAANGMTDLAARALGQMLTSNRTLCRLDVSANVFGEVLLFLFYSFLFTVVWPK